MTLFAHTPTFSLSAMLRRDKWLIRLRWYAILGLFSGVLLLKSIHLGSTTSIFGISIVGLALIVVNAIYLAYATAKKKLAMAKLVTLMNVQMVVDLFLLTILIYLTGSAESPLSFFYVFHIILASIIFPGGFSYRYSVLVVALYSGLLFLEHSIYLNHLCFFRDIHVSEDSRIVIAIWFIFVITMLVSAYLAQNVTDRHRRVRNKLEIANRKLMEINDSKTTFFRYASHEMKAPVATIQSTLMVVEDLLGTQVDERVRDLLKRAINRTSATIGMLKDLADLTYGNFQEQQKFETLNLKELLSGIVSDAKPNADRKNQTLVFDPPPVSCDIFGDAIALNKLFSNIVSNASRYTQESGKIEVVLSKSDASYTITVSDNGPGIPKSEQINIFKEFYRTPEAKKQISEGTGLGLAIVLRMVELHDGHIQVESQEGQGCKFIVELPMGTLG